MRSPTKQAGTDRRSAERRAEPVRAVKGERRVVEQRGVVTSMVDALEDILKWERASERAIRVAEAASTTDLDVSTN
jgi:hypothetical protein